MRKKHLALLTAALLMSMLAGCGSNRSSDGSSSGSNVVAAKVGSNTCEICHTAIVAQGWVGSEHQTAGDTLAGCEGCHGGGQFHKGIGEIPTRDPGITECATCHETFSPGFLTRHSEDLTTTSYDTTPSTPTIEGYVKVEDCLGCHSARTSAATQWQHDPNETDINKDWAQSGHAGHIASATPDTESVWGHYDWDQSNRASCQRCHTATGAKNFLTSPGAYNSANNDFSHLTDWTAATGSNQNELLFCWACHSDVGTGTLRNPGAITETYSAATSGDPATTVAYPDIDKSNVCMACHIGRETGEVIKNNVDADGVRGFINSHYLTAGATLFNESGYEFAGQTYNSGYHKEIGVADTAGTGTDGPCVSCHMHSAEQHTFEVVTKDGAGTVTAVNSTACASCHATMSASLLEEKKATFVEAMEALKDALEAKGIYFGEAYPYFFTAPYVVGGTNTGFTNWNSVAVTLGVGLDIDATGTGWKNVMGAAFNYNLFEHDPGAYAHNRTYALSLIRDSIDFLGDGLVDGDVNVATELVAKGVNIGTTAGYSAIHDAPITMPSAVVCSACHAAAPHYGGTVLVQAQFVAPATTLDADGSSCSDCHAGGVISANGAIIAQYAESGHGDVLGEAWLHYDWRASNRASCARCHNGTAYISKLGIESDTTWLFAAGDANLSGETLGCASCHTSVTTGAVRTPGVYTETYSDGQTFVFPDIGKSNLCIRCHSGRESGGTILADTDADGVRSFINSHYLTAGGTVFTTTGYEYTGQNYADPASYAHKDVGIAVPGSPTAADAGPCAGCHMGTGTDDHSWKVVTEDATGVITAINSNTCASCHTGASALTPAILETEKEEFNAALDALKTVLESKGMYFGEAYPYFFTAPYVVGGTNTGFTDWASVYGFAFYKDTMGAAFNYNLLKHDPGAYAHNRYYAKRLIFDAIDFLDNGVLDGTISVTGDAATYLGTTRP